MDRYLGCFQFLQIMYKVDLTFVCRFLCACISHTFFCHQTEYGNWIVFLIIKDTLESMCRQYFKYCAIFCTNIKSILHISNRLYIQKIIKFTDEKWFLFHNHFYIKFTNFICSQMFLNAILVRAILLNFLGIRIRCDWIFHDGLKENDWVNLVF